MWIFKPNEVYSAAVLEVKNEKYTLCYNEMYIETVIYNLAACGDRTFIISTPPADENRAMWPKALEKASKWTLS